jgi:hypothetical protein
MGNPAGLIASCPNQRDVHFYGVGADRLGLEINMLLENYAGHLRACPRERVAASIERTMERVTICVNGNVQLEAWQNGCYEVKTVSGRTLRCQADNLPAVLQIGGPWDVSFPVQTDASRNVTLDQLISWSDHADLDVKYSGTATYRNTFREPVR